MSTRTVNLHVRITEAMYDSLVKATEASELGETVSDVVRAAIKRETDLRERRTA